MDIPDHTSSAQRRSFRVVVWTGCWIVALQVLTTCLPGYPWPARTQPEIAVHAERYFRDGGWTRTSPTLEESIIQWQVHHLMTDVPPQDIVFVGDSSCLMGIMPDRITAATNLPAWNLGTVGSLSTQGQARILDLYLQRHAATKPKLIVCCFATPTLQRTSEQVEQLGVLNRFREWLDGADAGAAARAPLAQLPGYRLRRPFYLAATEFLNAEQPELILNTKRGQFPSDDSVRKSLLSNRGYLPEPRRQQLPPHEPFAISLLTPDSLAGIVRIFDLANANSVPLLFVMTPLPESYRGPASERAFERLEQQLRVAAIPFPSVEIGSPLLRYLADQDFGTPNHLTEAAAPRNTDRLAELIGESLIR